MKLSKEEAFEIIVAEGEFSNQFDCEISSPPYELCDRDKPLELWLLWMEQYLVEARQAATSGYNKPYALDRLRCVLSLGVKAAMHHGLPVRK